MDFLGRYLGLVCGVLGAVALVMAYRELSLPTGSSELQKITLQELASGLKPNSDYVELGPYAAMPEDGAFVPVEPTTKLENSSTNSAIAIKAFYFPIGQMNGPIINTARSGRPYFDVLVKTERFSTLAEARAMSGQGASMEGMIINTLDPLSPEERSAIQAFHPTIDFDQVLVLEQGRKPHSRGAGYGLALVGVLMLALPLVGFVKARIAGAVTAAAAVSAPAAEDQPLELVPVAATPHTSVRPPAAGSSISPSRPPGTGADGAERFAIGARVNLPAGARTTRVE